jgi:hypothetical protein
VGIGINTGRVVVGTIGGGGRVDVTVIGKAQEVRLYGSRGLESDAGFDSLRRQAR